MKVLMVTTFPPRRCGIGDYAADLAGHLSKTEDLQLRILTYPDGLTAGVAQENGFEVSRELQGNLSVEHLAKEIGRYDPDMVHLQSASFLHPPSLNRKLAEACAVPLVTTVHDAPGSWRVFRAIPGLRKIYGKSSRLFVHTAAVKSTLCQFHDADPRKIVEISHGVDTGRYSPMVSRDEALRTYPIAGRRVVLFFGFVRPGKGLETLLEAWRTIESSFPDAVLVIAGGVPTDARRYHLLLRSEADYPSRLAKLAARMGISDRVVPTGFVPEPLVPSLLASAEVIVLPYIGEIAQSGPLHKSLAAGRAIVATDVGAFRSIIEDGSDGLIVPRGDHERLAGAIKRLLDNPYEARKLAERARQKAESRLSWSITAAKTLGVYRELCPT